MPRWTIALLAAVAALALTACEPAEPEFTAIDQVPAADRPAENDEEPANGEPASDLPTYTFVAVDIDYSDAPSEVQAGPQVWELVNDGAIVHDVVIEELNSLQVAEAQGGETDAGEVTLDPGEYTYYCSVPGHRAAGMEGTLTATQ